MSPTFILYVVKNQKETKILSKFLYISPQVHIHNALSIPLESNLIIIHLPMSTLSFPTSYTGLVGLRNLGLTCYMNAALQALSNSMPLAHFMIECPAFLRTDRKTPGLARPFQRLMLEMWHRKRPSFVTPSVLYHGFKQVRTGTLASVWVGLGSFFFFFIVFFFLPSFLSTLSIFMYLFLSVL